MQEITNVRKRRQELGLTQNQLAAQSGVPQGRIQAIESGLRVPSLNQLFLFSKPLKCSVRDLINETAFIANTEAAADK